MGVLNPTIADELLVVAASLLLFLEIYALRMVHVLRRKLDGGSGGYLLRVVFRFGAFVVLGQSLTVLNSILRLANPEGTYDTRLMVLLIGEIILAVAFLWTVWEIHHLPADRYGENASVESAQPCECFCKQINDSIAPATTASAPVDQRHDDAPVAPV